MISNSIFCPMIHNGMHIVYSSEIDQFRIQSCCLRGDGFLVKDSDNIWDSSKFISLRETNNKGIWDPRCFNCRSLEKSQQASFRTGTLDKFGIKRNLSGPQRIDLMFDKSCNLACRSCGPESSTFWQQHLKINNLYPKKIERYDTAAEKVIDFLKKIDLSHLEVLVFCGGETLMGHNYWKVAEYLSTAIPNVKTQLTLSFQTNGTQPVPKKYFELIERFHLVKFNISLDATEEKFNYLRWPAEWNQVVDNIFNLRDNLPVNVMFVIEETISIFNLYYQLELEQWTKINFNSNRLGDIINHTRHVANGQFGLHNLTREYAEALECTNLYNFVQKEKIDNPTTIKSMISSINRFDLIRKEDWRTTFPEVAEFYSRYL
jgi:sulfatase maturation enzyme AslB (radical SAM superfamily)